jgi:hypothetical protein
LQICKEIPEKIGSQGWEQFLATKQEMLHRSKTERNFGLL